MSTFNFVLIKVLEWSQICYCSYLSSWEIYCLKRKNTIKMSSVFKTKTKTKYLIFHYFKTNSKVKVQVRLVVFIPMITSHLEIKKLPNFHLDQYFDCTVILISSLFTPVVYFVVTSAHTLLRPVILISRLVLGSVV